MFAKLHTYGPSAVLLVVSGYIVKLALTESLGYYIHPRFHLLTIISVIVLSVIIVISFFLRSTRDIPWHNSKHVSVSAIVAISIIGLALLIPPVPLSPQASSQRLSVDVAKRIQSLYSPSQRSTCDGTIEGERPTTLHNWQVVIANCKHDKALNGTPINITGFVVGTDGGLYGSDVFYIGRYFVSCCAVDADPVTLPVKTTGPLPQENSWLSISGTLQQSSNNDDVYIITDATIKKTVQPEDSYEYL